MTKRNNGSNKDEDVASDRATSLAPRNAGPTDLNQFIESVFRGFDASLSQLFPSFSSTELSSSPSVDLIDHGNHYTLTAELPGFTKDEVDVRVDENTLELSAERKEQKEKKEKDHVRTEHTHSVFHRVISIPESVSSSKVTGTMKNGVLELKLPKKEPVLEGRTRRVHLA
jgi:HSP20 family protein